MGQTEVESWVRKEGAKERWWWTRCGVDDWRKQKQEHRRVGRGEDGGRCEDVPGEA